MRTRPGVMTEKLPAQSFRDVTSSASRCPTLSGLGIGMRNNTTPHTCGSADRPASSPKSLSKVSKIRCSRAAHASTSGHSSQEQWSLPKRYRARLPRWRRLLHLGNSRWRETARQAALGKTFSELSMSRAYAKQARTSSCVMPG